jgi:hypothetical protein
MKILRVGIGVDGIDCGLFRRTMVRCRAAHDGRSQSKDAIAVARFKDSQVPKLAAYLKDKLVKGGFVRGLFDRSVGETAVLTARYRELAEEADPLVLTHGRVEAKREDWTRDPFTMVEERLRPRPRGDAKFDLDDRANLPRLKTEGYRPNRDLILVFSG